MCAERIFKHIFKLLIISAFTNIQNYCNDATTSFCDKSSINIYKIDMDNEEVINMKTYSWNEEEAEFVHKV